MYRLSLTYCQSTSNATHSDTFAGMNFTGKEKDAESGYHYFGARYYDADLLTGWMSVDPMADKYPSLSPYNYCAWNPVRLVDEDGCELDIPPFLAVFCSADKQADSFVNNSRRKGNFVKNCTSTYDSKGRNVVTVSPKRNDFVDNYDLSELRGTMLPCVNVSSHKPDPIEFADGGVYHFFQRIGNSIRHFENRIEGRYDGANIGAGCSWKPRNWGIGVNGTMCIIVGGHIQFGVYCDDIGLWNNYFGADFCLGFEIGASIGVTYSPGGISGKNSSISASLGAVSASFNSANTNAPTVSLTKSHEIAGKIGASWQLGQTWSWYGK